MISTTTEVKNAIADRHEITARVSIMLNDSPTSPTTLILEKNTLMAGGVTINDGTSNTGSFDIGSAIINQCTVLVNNTDGNYSNYNFEKAVATVFAGVVTNDAGSVTWLKKGVFILSDPTTTPAVITLKGVDYMSKFDRDYDGNMTFPRTIGSIVQYCCTQCGVDLETTSFTNSGYLVSNNPFEGEITYRQIISWCAQIACSFARCNVDGRLELKWYDTAAFDTGNEYRRHSVTKISQGPNVNTEDVVITGIRVTASDAADGTEGESALSGNDGYILEISDNPLIAYGRASETAALIAAVARGMRFRPGSASILGDPTMEAGDAALVTDRKGNQYKLYLTNLTFVVGNFASISCDAEPALRKSADRYSKLASTVAKTRKELTTYVDSYVQSQISMDTLAANALGFFESYERQQDGSVIKYAHNKPTLAQSTVIYKQTADGFFLARRQSTSDPIVYENGIDSSGKAVLSVIAAIGVNADWVNTGTLTVGGPSGGGTVQITVKDQSGTVIGTWGSSGITATNADISGKITATSGKIGDWEIKNGTIRRDKNDGVTNVLIQAPASDNSIVLAIGAPWSSTLNRSDWDASPFIVRKTGALKATDADITGKITASEGSIGGWEMNSHSIYNRTQNTTQNAMIQIPGNNTTWVFSIGAPWDSGTAPSWGDSPFRVNKAGKMYASGAQIDGEFSSINGNDKIVIKDGAITGYERTSATSSWVKSGSIDISQVATEDDGQTYKRITIKAEQSLYFHVIRQIFVEFGSGRTGALQWNVNKLTMWTKIDMRNDINFMDDVKSDGHTTYYGPLSDVPSNAYVRRGLICTS